MTTRSHPHCDCGPLAICTKCAPTPMTREEAKADAEQHLRGIIVPLTPEEEPYVDSLDDWERELMAEQTAATYDDQGDVVEVKQSPQMKYYYANRENELDRMRWNATFRKYGVTREHYYAMLSEQFGGCAICFTEEPGRGNKYFAIDHNHETGAVRGLLCHGCNTGAGMFNDDPVRLRLAADYLEKHDG